ncbi:MAG: hypothetical protein ACI849_000687 [Patiriisocius sp.]|jgi:hypothetical protein
MPKRREQNHKVIKESLFLPHKNNNGRTTSLFS